MLRGASFPRITRPTLKGKNLTINTTVEGHKVQVTQINSSLNKSSFHVKTSQKAAQITINSTPKSFRFCVQPTKTTNLKNEQPELVFLVNRRHNSNGKEDKTEDKQNADKQNPLSTNYHTSLPVSKHSPEHMFEPIPKAAVMPSLWFFLIAILLIKEMLSRQSEGIANDLVTLFRRYEEAKASQDEERIRQAETDLIQFVNMGSLMFMMGNPKLSSPELMQEISNFLLQSHTPQLTELVLTLFSAVVHSSRASFAQADLPLSALATKFADKDILRDTTVVSSLSQVLDTLVIDGYDLNKIASATGMVTLVDLMAHHPDATISTRASHILRAFAQNASTAPAVQDNVATLIHVIKRKENTESVIYAKEAIQGLLAASGNNPEFRSAVENQLYNGTVSKDLANEIIKFERPVSFSKIPKITTELTLGVLIAIGWGYIRWTRALKKKGVSAEDIKQIVKYRTALTAGVTAVAVGTSILEDNVIAHHSEVASDVVAFIGWPLFLAVTPFIIVPSFLSAIASAQAFDKICDEHRR